MPSGITSPIPMLEWFIADADYNAIISNPTADIERPAVIAYNGTVIDNVAVNIRGANSQTSPKPNWKFELPHNYTVDFAGLVEPVDEFAMQADWSDKSHGRPLLSWDAYQRAGVVQRPQLFPMRTQRNAQFQGLYTYVDLFDGTWRDREGYGDQTVLQVRDGRLRRDPARSTCGSRRRTRRRRLHAAAALPQRHRPDGQRSAQLPARQPRHPRGDQHAGRDRRSSTTRTSRRRTSTSRRIPPPVAGR